MVKRFLFLIIWIFWALPVQAEANIFLEVSPSSGTLDDEFTMSVTITGSGASDYPVLSGGDDFKLTLIGPETSVNIINGKISQQTRYVYRLVPTKVGTLSTPSAEIEVNGQKLTAPSVSVTITGGHAPSVGNQDIFSRHTLSSEEVYVGQQVLESTEFYSSKAVTNLEIGDSTQDGFVSQTLGEPDKGIRNIDGQRYSVVWLKRALFPLRPGEQTVSAPEVKGESREVKRPRPGSLFGGLDPFHDDLMQDFFGTVVTKPFSVRGPDLKLRVKPLPTPPPGVSEPIVGSLELSNSFQNAPIKAGESKTIEIEVRSTGNLNLLKSLPLEADSNFKLYRENPATRTRVISGKLETTKTFRFSVVPLVSGHFVLPPIRIPYFNPTTERYEIAANAEIAFEVLGESLVTPSPVKPTESVPRDKLASEDSDTVPGGVVVTPEPGFLQPVILALIFGLVLLAASGWWWSRRPKMPRMADAIRQIERAEGAAALNSALRYGLEVWARRARLEAENLETFSGDELRRWLNGKIPRENLFEVEVLLDELAYLSYGAAADEPQAQILDPLKSRIKELILKLPR